MRTPRARDRPPGAQPQHALGGPRRRDAIEDAHHALREGPDAGVRGLRGERAELAVRDDEEAVLARPEHHSAMATLGVRCSPVARSTAGSRWLVSPYSSPCTTWRRT